MSGEKETAFVLPEGEASAPVHFGGFPGVFEPGRPVAVSALGFETVAEARTAREEHASSLKEARVAESSAPMPEQVNHLPNSEQAKEVGQEAAPPPETPGDEPGEVSGGS